MRGRKPRTWIKLDCYGVLHGSINYLLTLEEQAVWLKLIPFSAICGGEPGLIQDNEGKGLPHGYIAHELHCPLPVFESMLKKMKTDKAVSENGTGIIELLNFQTYQFTEYDRQRPYRDKKRAETQRFKKLKFCPDCKYSIEDCKTFVNMEVCPRCRKKGKEVLLIKRENPTEG